MPTNLPPDRCHDALRAAAAKVGEDRREAEAEAAAARDQARRRREDDERAAARREDAMAWPRLLSSAGATDGHGVVARPRVRPDGKLYGLMLRIEVAHGSRAEFIGRINTPDVVLTRIARAAGERVPDGLVDDGIAVVRVPDQLQAEFERQRIGGAVAVIGRYVANVQLGGRTVAVFDAVRLNR